MKKKTKSKGGRPTKYKKDYARMAYSAASEVGGYTDLKLAKLFDVTKSTVALWKNEHPAFSDSIRSGKDIWDSLTAEQSMLKRVVGYDYTETVREPDDNGEMVVVREVTKHLPPDVKATDIWMCNRNPERWRKLKHVELTGKDGGAIEVATVDYQLKQRIEANLITESKKVELGDVDETS